MSPLTQHIQEILLRDHLVSAADIEKSLNEQKASGAELSSILLKFKLISEDQLILVLSEALNIPLINLFMFKIDPAIIKLVPASIAQTHQLIPLSFPSILHL